MNRDGDLFIAASTGTDEQHLRDFVLEKRYWIYQELAQQAGRRRTRNTSTAGLTQLSRSYQFKRVPSDAQSAPLKLIARRFQLRGPTQCSRTFRPRASDWLNTKAKEHSRRMQVEPAGVKVQDLG